VPLSVYTNQTAVMLDDIRGHEVSTGWVWGLLSGQRCEQVEGECDDNKTVYFVQSVCNSAGHK